jgi:hypothetical protein
MVNGLLRQNLCGDYSSIGRGLKEDAHTVRTVDDQGVCTVSMYYSYIIESAPRQFSPLWQTAMAAMLAP